MATSGRDTGTATRIKAWALRADGWSDSAIGRVLGVTRQAVSAWFRSSKARQAFERAQAGGTLPALSDDEQARLSEQSERARKRPNHERDKAADSERSKAGAAGTRVLRLHNADGAVGPLLNAAMAKAYAHAAGRCVSLLRALVFAGVEFFEAQEWAGRLDAGDADALPLRSLYERARASGIVELLDRVWDGEGAPATAWQVLQRVAPEFADTPDAGGAADPLADMADDELAAGLDEVREHLSAG